jgi:hypothetical protein
MQLIPSTYWHSDYEFTLLHRTEKAAVYECTNFRGAHAQKTGFEVHRIRIAPAGEYRGLQLPEREVLSTIREWGEFGWSYLSTDYKGALKRFNSIKTKPAPLRDDSPELVATA